MNAINIFQLYKNLQVDTLKHVNLFNNKSKFLLHKNQKKHLLRVCRSRIKFVENSRNSEEKKMFKKRRKKKTVKKTNV